MKPGPNAIEQWCKEVERLEVSPLTDDQMGTLLKCHLLSEKLDNDKEVLALIESKNAGLLSALWLRVKFCHTYKITVSAAIFISETIVTNFGMSTMVANYLQYMAFKYKQKEITLDFICQKVWPFGFPTSEQWGQMWDKQKLDRDFLCEHQSPCYLGSDNGLDNSEFAKSIQTIES